MNYLLVTTALAATVFAASPASALPLAPTQIRAELKADDEFKIYLSSTPGDRGVEFGQGLGWNLGYEVTLVRLGNVGTYYLNVWVRDIGGDPRGLVGKFTLPPGTTCRFANGAINLTTDTKHWKVTEPQPYSTPVSIALPGVPAEIYFNNDQPRFVRPTLTPLAQGPNSGPNPWSTITGYTPAGIQPTATWIKEPGNGANKEAWYQTTIRCRDGKNPTGGGTGVPIDPPIDDPR